VRGALGEHVANALIENQTAQWNAFRLVVTEWEREQYLEIY
jgi:glutamine synthetase